MNFPTYNNQKVDFYCQGKHKDDRPILVDVISQTRGRCKECGEVELKTPYYVTTAAYPLSSIREM